MIEYFFQDVVHVVVVVFVDHLGGGVDVQLLIWDVVVIERFILRYVCGCYHVAQRNAGFVGPAAGHVLHRIAAAPDLNDGHTKLL